MNSNDRSENCLPSYESVCEDIAKLRSDLCSQLTTFIRNLVGNTHGQSDFQIYMKVKSVLMDLPISLKPKEASWPIIFLEVFMPDSIDWPTHLRLEKVI